MIAVSARFSVRSAGIRAETSITVRWSTVTPDAEPLRAVFRAHRLPIDPRPPDESAT